MHPSLHLAGDLVYTVKGWMVLDEHQSQLDPFNLYVLREATSTELRQAGVIRRDGGR